MFLNILKNWTLPVSMITGSLVYLFFSEIQALDSFSEKADIVITAIFPFVMMTILFTTFCKVDYRSLRLCRWHGILVLCQFFMTAVFLLVSHTTDVFQHNSIVLEALLICVIAPCAAAAPVVTNKIGGNLESMTSYTILSNVVSAIAIPIVYTLMPPLSGREISGWELFAKLMQSTATILLLPLVLAWLVRHFMPRLHRTIVSIRDLSFYLWALSLSIVSGITVKNILHTETTAMLLAQLAIGSLLVCVLQFAIGKALGKLQNAQLEAGQGLGQKNTAFAIWLATTHFDPVSSLAPGCYILWQNIINSWEIASHKGKK